MRNVVLETPAVVGTRGSFVCVDRLCHKHPTGSHETSKVWFEIRGCPSQNLTGGDKNGGITHHCKVISIVFLIVPWAHFKALFPFISVIHLSITNVMGLNAALVFVC